MIPVRVKEFLQPILCMKMKYLPLLTIYFADAFAVFSQIAYVFWIKDSLSLTTDEIISISILANLPWSMKIIFGQLLDSFKIAGSQRKSYTFIAAFLMLVGNIVTICVANGYEAISNLSSVYKLLIFSGFLVSLGVIIQDLVADTLCNEVVDKHKSDESIKQEIGNIQILVRMTQIVAGMIAIGISGVITSKFGYATISYFIPIIALISIAGSLIVKKEPVVRLEKMDMNILSYGLVYLSVIMLFIFVDFDYSKEVIFIVGMVIVSTALYKVCDHLSSQQKKEIFCILLVIFTCRAVPVYGPGIGWWQIDVLDFTPEYYSILAQIGKVLSIFGLWFFAKRIINRDVGMVMLLLNTIHVVLQLPMIAMAFGFHQWTMENFGFGAKAINIVDNMAEGPFMQLSFLMLCTVATYYAPKKNIATWFALVMSLMSLAFVSGGRILTGFLSNLYPIERGSYENVGELMMVTSLINFLMPTIIILIFMNPFSKKKLSANHLTTV
jgi:hypothetical protein